MKKFNFSQLMSMLLVSIMIVGMVQIPLPAIAENTTVNAATTGVTINSASDLLLYPAPRNLTAQSGKYTLTNGYIQSDDSSLKSISKIQQDAYALTGVNLNNNTASAVVKINKDDTLNEQGYSLVINADGITITYKDEPGAYYAAATLYQIIWQAGKDLPYLSIQNDYPDFKYRAFDMDISRNRIPKLETLKQVVDTMANLKFNQFFLYLEGYSYAYESYPEAWQTVVPLTPQEIAELTQYANERGIDLIPAQNSLGHSAKVVSTYPELADKTSGQVLNVFKSETQQYLSNIYDDLYNGFQTDYLQVGGDETTFDLTSGTAAASWKALNPGLEPTNADIYYDSMEILYNLVKQKNKKMLYWSDMIVKYESYAKAKELMPDAIAMNWCYYAGSSGLGRFDYSSKGLSGAGIPFYVCPGDQSWSTIVGNTNEMKANAQNAAIKGKQYGAIGYCMTNWGDGGHYQNLITTYPGLAYAGGLSWCADTNTEGVNSYDKYLNMFVYQDTTNTLSQAYSQIADYRKVSGLSGDIPKCLMNDTWNGFTSSSFLWKVMNTNGDTTIDASERDALITKCEQVSLDVSSFLNVLSNANMQAGEHELLYKEFRNTALTLKATVDYMVMRAKLLTGGDITKPLSTKYELSDKIIENSKEFQEVVEDFKYIWGERDLVNNLSSTMYQFRNASTFYKSEIGARNIYEPQSDGNLFLMTPDTIGTGISASGGIAGNKTWSHSGIYTPATTISQIGGTTVEKLKGVFNSGAFSIVDAFDNANKKVFAYDTGAAINGGFYDVGTGVDKLMPILGFPVFIPNEGAYKFTAKAKYKSGQGVNADTVAVSAYANKTSNSTLMSIGDGSQLTVAAPDANGWSDVTINFNASDCEAASINLIPVNSITNDTLYVTDYVLKCEETTKAVISSFYDKSSVAYTGTSVAVPKAITTGTEPIVVTIKNPEGTVTSANIGDSLAIDKAGTYTLTYSAADVATPLVLTITAEYIYQDLQDLVNKIEAMDLSKYTDETVGALNTKLVEAKALIADNSSTREVLDVAMANLQQAKNALALKRAIVGKDMITVTASAAVYRTYVLNNSIDGNLDTYAYLADYQTVGDYIQFTFSEPVNIDGVQIINNTGTDLLDQGEFQVSTDGVNWTSMGAVAKLADQTIDFDAVEVNYARILCTKDVRFWWKLNEIIFYIEVPDAVDESHYIVSGMSINKAKTEDKYANAYNSTYPASNIIDADKTTMGANAFYFATAGAASKTLTVIDLGADYELKAVELTLPTSDQITTAFNATSPVSTYKQMNANGSGIYVSNSVPAYSDFNGFEIATTSTATDLVRLQNGGNSLSSGNWDPSTRGTSVCNELQDGKTYRYLSIWAPYSGGHALNEIKVKTVVAGGNTPTPNVEIITNKAESIVAGSTATMRQIFTVTTDTDVEAFGTYFVPFDIFTDGSYSNCAQVSVSGAIASGETFSADLTNIPETGFAKAILALPYVVIGDVYYFGIQGSGYTVNDTNLAK